MLQKPNSDRSNNVHSQHLERHLALSRSGNVSDLLEESLCIQLHLLVPKTKGRRPGDSLSDTVFSKLVFDGKIISAIKYISQDSHGGVLSMDDSPISGSSRTVRDILLEKHPTASTPPDEVLIEEGL